MRSPSGEAPPTPERTTGRWLLGIALLAVAVSLTIRVVHRGPYIPGWDLIAPTEGHFLASTRSVPDAIAEVFHQNRHFWLPFSVFSAPFSLIPGYLGRVWPWLYWVHILTFLTFVATLVLIHRAADLRPRDAAIILLAWGASPMLLSCSVAGYPWASGFLPHAIALWITMNRRLRARWFLTLLCALAANELSWHVYEIGKTVALVFLAAVVLQRDVRKATRAVWLLAGCTQLYEMLFLHRTSNIQTFAFQRGGGGSSVVPIDLPGIAHGLWTLAASFVTADLDLPVLLVVGVLGLCWFRRDRWLVLVLLVAQLGLVTLLAMGLDLLRPRRFLMVECYAVVCIACAYREAGVGRRRVLVALLAAGNVWQGVNLVAFARTPFPMERAAFPMPYVHSKESVGFVSFPHVEWGRELLRHVEAGNRLLMVYNFDCYTENLTNPVGVLERLYLSLGHERFVRSVFAFGSNPCRYSCLPIRPLADFDAFLDGIRPDGPTPPAGLEVHYTRTCEIMSAGKEPAAMLSTLQRRFHLTPTRPPGGDFLSFTIDGPVAP